MASQSPHSSRLLQTTAKEKEEWQTLKQEIAAKQRETKDAIMASMIPGIFSEL